ncbi:MAG: hypothetical protein U0822_12950 [Anaerolineae bacterium]
MNPFTRYIRTQRADRIPSDVRAFVDRWDRLEALVINVYRAGQADEETEKAYAELRAWLQPHYPAFAPLVAPYWRNAREAGNLPASDPFERLFAPESASAFAGTRTYMQALPPAREAINTYLLTLP